MSVSITPAPSTSGLYMIAVILVLVSDPLSNGVLGVIILPSLFVLINASADSSSNNFALLSAVIFAFNWLFNTTLS